MVKKLLVIFGIIAVFSSFFFASSILFDAGHGQSVGNADWTIDGAYSDFAHALRRFFEVYETYRPLTLSLLKAYKVLVIPEPNIPFSKEEENAIVKFVKDGGGVFLIADHEGADRNHDGWDAVSIYDDFVKAFGFEFARDTQSQYPIKYVFKTPITLGVKNVGEWAGSTLKIFGKNVHIAVELYTHQPYVIYGTYGKGRFVAIGDSSPFDDGSGASWKSLYDGWHTGDDGVLAINSVYWLATAKSVDSSIYLKPPVVKSIDIVSPLKIVVSFNKKILPDVEIGINLNITRAKIEKIEVGEEKLTIVLKSALSKGKHLLITRGIEDVYGNESPLSSVPFEY